MKKIGKDGIIRRRSPKSWWNKEIKLAQKSKTAADAKYQAFYCTVCKMATWTFHEHDGQNFSTTKRKVKAITDVTNIK